MEEEQQQKRHRSQQQQQQQQPQARVPCARCGSIDTKFCYYNNYNTSQPRYYCRTCKRHWTHGGTLRNVPEGGSSKKTKKKPSSSSSSSSASSLKLAHQQFLHDQPPALAAAGISNSDRGPLPPPSPLFLGAGGGRAAGVVGGGLIRDDLAALPAFANPAGGIVGDFARANPPPGFNPLVDGITLQQLVQQPRLSLALHQNLLMFQQQQGNWRQNSPAAPFAAPAPTIAADTTEEEIRNRNNSMFNMPRPPPPPSSFM
ncbi:hypothetical protein Cni_G00540 [Canna indica]|uniref:Dof zinc finger protein n=1 Tax=Canna indica TaxID=4628 RepID=A0AAQ3JL39_9LILI|nr:hypothetical protein Cni_G00540 [Canna indica]